MYEIILQSDDNHENMYEIILQSDEKYSIKVCYSSL